MAAPHDQSNSEPERADIAGTDAAGIEASINSLVSAITEVNEQARLRDAAEREIALRGLESAERTEQLQYELALAQIESNDEKHRRRFGLGRLIIIIIGIALLGLLVLAGVVVAVAFFGDDRQSQTALAMLRYGFTAAGGGGITLLMVYGIISLARWWQGM